MKKTMSWFLALGLFLWTTSALADATVVTFVKFGGFKGNGAYDGTTISRIQGHKQAEASSIRFTGAILSLAAGGSDITTITRADKGVVWVLDSKKKVCTETPIAMFNPEDISGKKEGSKDEKPRVRVLKSRFTVKKTGASQTINGFPCEEYLMSWILDMEDLETKAKKKSTMETNSWTTPETTAIRKLQADEAAFARAYSNKAGMNVSPEEMKQYGMGIFAMATGASEKDMEKEFKVFKKEMSKIRGYPIRTVVNWKVDDSLAAVSADKDAADSPMPVDLSGGWGGIVASVIGQKVAQEVKPDVNAPFFSSTMEVKSILADTLSAGIFEIPEGYVLEVNKN